MRKSYSFRTYGKALLIFLIVFTVSRFTGSGQTYCTPSNTPDLYTSGCGGFGDYIESFSTSGGATNISNTNSGCSTGSYNFLSQSHTGVQGTTVGFSITNNPTETEGYKIWVDWNNDGTFNDADELVYSPATTMAGADVTTGSFSIPVAAVPGTKRLRIRCVFNTTTFTACSSHTWGEIEDYNFIVVAATPCTGIPNAGNATTTISNILCPGAQFTLGLAGSSLQSGLSYQWQSSPDNTTWTSIATATAFNYTTTQAAPTMYYRNIVTCTAGGGKDTSVEVQVTNNSGPTYAALPFTESFEATWMNTCNTREIPNNSWRNTPGTGNNSWRRNDDGVAAAWTNVGLGTYSPTSTQGAFSARFHSYNVASGGTGVFDLHLNCNTSATTKRLTFDFINTSGTDSLTVLLSTDGGTTFTRLDSATVATAWRTKTIVFNSSSATTVMRFRATSDDGTTDIGIDNMRVTDFDNCTGTPVGGTTTSTMSNTCLTTPFTLAVTGATDANGLLYQWQASTDGGATWNDIPGATNFILTLTQAQTTRYRLKITCSFNSLFATSAPVLVTSPPLPIGNYTINNLQATDFPTGTNFQNFNDAYQAMICGIAGSVTFDVMNGPYNEQLIMNAIPGTSATRTVTFKGNGKLLLFASANNTERAVIKLKGTRHIIFDSLIIDASTGTYGYGVQLMSNADSNTFRKCVINSSLTSTSTNFAGIVISGSDADAIGTGNVLCDANLFSENKVNGGYYGITLAATFSGGANGFNQFVKNDVKEFYQYGIYVTGSYNTLIEKNRFSRPTRATVGEFNGIYFNAQSNSCSISKNRIYNPFGGAASSSANFFGINFNNSSASAGNDNTVSNNLIYDVNGNGAVVGLANSGSSNVLYLHNTISLDNTASISGSTTRGFQQQTTAGGLVFFNNIITITRGGTGQKHCVYLGADLPVGIDYNDYYINAAGGTNYIGFYTTNRATLANWQTATAQEANSFSINPVYTDPSPAVANFSPANAGIDNKGLPIGIDSDIDDNVRTAPDVGAYEFVPPPCSIPPVKGTATMSTNSICEGNPVFFNLNIGAFGSGQTFQWEYAVSPAGPYIPLGTPMLTPDTTIMSDTTLYYRCAVRCLTSVDYSDTVLLNVSPAFPAGTYTINPIGGNTYVPGTPGGNFISFNAAKAAMANCGILGPIVFNVVVNSGPYNEQLKLDSIKGMSAINTITFNGNGNTISFSSTSTTERAVIKLNGADHVIFDSLVIDGSAGVYGYGVQLISNADSNTFRRCKIITSTTSTAASYAGIVINAADGGPTSTGNTFCDGNTFDRNTITGGYYGVTLLGNTNALIKDNSFTNNIIEEFYSHGLYVGGTLNTLVEGNTFRRPARATNAGPLYGIQLTAAANNGLKVSKNRFTNFFGGATGSTSTLYVIHHNSASGPTGNENIISNNLMYDLGGNGPLYGLYNLGSSNVFYYHNTISLDNNTSTATGATVGFFQQGNASGIQFKNNIVTIKRGGTGTKHAIYLATLASEVESNNNDLFLNAPGTANYVGFFNTNQATLANWQAASGDDALSLSVEPVYTNPAVGNFMPAFLPLDNKGVFVNINSDILNAARSSSTPDIGAFEFVPPVCTAPPVAGTATVTPNAGLCLETPIQLNLTGNSPLGTITFQWEHSSDGVNWTPLSGIQYTPEFNALSDTNTYYRAKVTCNASSVYSTVVQLSLNQVLVHGTYTIDPANTANNWPSTGTGRNFPTFQSAVNAMMCGITGPVVFNVAPGTYTEQIRIPYIRNMSVANNVIFQSANGVASSVNLTFASTAAGTNYTLKLDSTRYMTFRNMTITATNSSFGRVVEIGNGASYDSLVNCTITAPVVTTASTNTAAIYSNASPGVQNTIRGNTISNGTNGIYFSGTSPAILLAPGHIIDSNTVTGAYSHGIVLQYASRIHLRKNKVVMNTAVALNSAGIFTNYADSAWKLTHNVVTIDNVTAGPVYGIVVSNTRAVMTDSAIIASNTVTAGAGNTTTVYGLSITTSKGISTVNNVIAINSAATAAYGLHNLNNQAEINYYNNTVNILAPLTGGYAGHFTQTTPGDFDVRNNIFSNKGSGKALFVNNPVYYSGDYNMLYTNGATLVEVASGTQLTFPSLSSWLNTWNWDHSSIVYAPAFVSNTDLHPNLTNPDVWAMHGRGVQVKGNVYDFDNNPRPDALTTGVPDMGAYEFYPTALPTALLATPAAPAANTTQIFSYGTDTVMKITWTGTPPPSVEVRRYSGVVPTGLLPGTDSMYFYTKVEIPGGSNYNYEAKLYYIDSWQGSIPQQSRLGLGRTTPSNAWVVGANSTVDVPKKEIKQNALIYLDRFTGLTNPFSTPEQEDSSSNRGKDFWVGYQRTNGFSDGNVQTMKLYLGADAVDAHVTVTIEGTGGTPWVRNYTVPANSALTSDEIPKTGIDDARLVNAGKYDKKGIHITSDVPIVAYAHIYESTNSGATMLMPTSVWGYEYYVLTSRQNYTSVSYSAFHVVAKDDNTWVEINPSNPTQNGWVPNGGTQPNGSYLVQLNKGDAFQVLGNISSGSEGYDLTGSYVKAIANGQGECHPIAVFSGSTRTGIGCGASAGGSGDLIIQQIFPYQAWGNKYATAPTSIDAGPNATSNMTNVYRIMVKDPTTQVKKNGITMTGIVNNRYYQYESNTADYIESNKPVLVAQFMASSGSCPNTGGDGDPEMFYLSPIQQAIKRTQFYRNNLTAIDNNFITLVIPTEGLQTLKIDGINYQAYPVAERYSYDHPALPNYSVVTKKWVGGNGSSTVESQFPFTGIVYGEGSVESYGYNLGTMVKNLNNLSSVDNVLNTGTTSTEYTCKGAQFTMSVLLPVKPDSILWQLSQVLKLSPNTDIMQHNPVAVDTVTVNGIDYYSFALTQQFVFDSAGIFTVPIRFWSPEVEKCDHSFDGKVIVQVLPAPATDFAVQFSGGGTNACEGETATFTGDLVTQNGIALNQWNWTFHNGTTPTGQTQTFTYPAAGTYPVTLKGITADGCVSDTTKQIVINARPSVVVTEDSIGVCNNGIATFTVSNPVAGVTYSWYNASSGGTALATGNTYTPTGLTPPQSFYVEGVSTAGCTSVTRTEVEVYALSALPPSAVTAGTRSANSVVFNWTAVPGAVAYQVSVNNGPYITPSSGTTGLTHTVTGLGVLETVSLIVKVINPCGETLSAPVTNCTNSSAAVVTDSLAVCNGTNATFTVQSPTAGLTYNWYDAVTGGTSQGTGTSFTTNGVTTTTTYYVQQQSAAGCIGTPRTRVIVTVLPPLTQITAAVDSTGPNFVRFRWNAVPGAASYQVSTNGGATFSTPSSGATGLTHTVINLTPLQEVTLIVRAVGAIACQTSTSAPVSGRALSDEIFIPNTFTPNGDAVNDVLRVYAHVIKESRFMVFNQWGEKIYESNTTSVAWDGTYKGKPQPSGVYMYVARFVLLDGTIVNKKGAINLIR
jgi:trimeric autotransporter adhesin